MIFYTHPVNAKHIEAVTVKANDTLRDMSCMSLRGVQIVYNDLIQPTVDSKVNFIPAEHPFCEYPTKNPAEWEIFCGLVKPVKEPHILMVDEGAYTVMREGIPNVTLY